MAEDTDINVQFSAAMIEEPGILLDLSQLREENAAAQRRIEALLKQLENRSGIIAQQKEVIAHQSDKIQMLQEEDHRLRTDLMKVMGELVLTRQVFAAHMVHDTEVGSLVKDNEEPYYIVPCNIGMTE